jgi:hypothetical protein
MAKHSKASPKGNPAPTTVGIDVGDRLSHLCLLGK